MSHTKIFALIDFLRKLSWEPTYLKTVSLLSEILQLQKSSDIKNVAINKDFWSSNHLQKDDTYISEIYLIITNVGGTFNKFFMVFLKNILLISLDRGLKSKNESFSSWNLFDSATATSKMALNLFLLSVSTFHGSYIKLFLYPIIRSSLKLKNKVEKVFFSLFLLFNFCSVGDHKLWSLCRCVRL